MFRVKVVSPLIFFLLFKDVLTLINYFFLCTWFQLATFQNTRSDFKALNLFTPKHTVSVEGYLRTCVQLRRVVSDYKVHLFEMCSKYQPTHTHTHTPGLSFAKSAPRAKKMVQNEQRGYWMLVVLLLHLCDHFKQRLVCPKVID